MKKQVVSIAGLALLALGTSSSVVCAAENEGLTSQVTNKTNVTLKEGSGSDVQPVVPDDTHDDDPSTGAKGSLSIPFASNITFGEQEIQQGDADYFALNKKPFVQVNDTRGGAKGWTLGVSISPFTSTDKDHSELTGAQLSLSNGQVVTKNNSSKAPHLVESKDHTFVLNEVNQTVMLAQPGEGAGAFVAVFEGTDGKNENVKLHVPRAGVEAKNYTAEITWTLSDAPV
ncbi:WxL domain-containing protein [Enterococcus hirae]|uniref:WxL domain-containing protein n=1 Tax=Enterococcus sp. C63 TaxID=3231324 RepID=UPI0019F3566E|nr:WxL domain-containing protein [Enterococcus hirae]EMF0130996.1 WxL domain-containing protein [Enterococcus hirae]EMF0448353.1 WxL domain-containing protein [Enterococcus hirae]EMF0517249.1 WxL domain-containing protein [Enterococcus hirae]EMF0519172.1 WxL domain-containing protein [Enterococcus hirae]